MTINEQLKTSFPPNLKPENKFFSALVSNDKKTGAIETVLNNVESYTQEYTSNSDVYKQTSDMLKKTASFFSFLEKYTDESDEGYIKRLKAIFYRGGDEVWGTPYNILHVFSLYFPHANIYLCENTQNIENNLIENGDFQDGEDGWNLSGSAQVTGAARFSKSYGVSLPMNGKLSQTISLNKKAYYLHFFLKGKIKVMIKNSSGKYWNDTVYWDDSNSKWQNGNWQNSEYYMEYESDEWNDFQTLILKNEAEDDIQINFIGNAETESWIDYIRLFEYKNPSFTLICHYQSNSDVDAAALAPGHDDKSTDPLDNYYYHDSAYLLGVNNGGFAQSIYEDLLKYVKAIGVQTFLEIVNRDEDTEV